MFKKILIVLVLLAVTLFGLQLFGGRDFTQISLATEKYQLDQDLSVFFSDVSTILKGGKVREGARQLGRIANKVMYRWTDEFGQIHFSEKKPSTGQFETIRLGELEYQIQKGMSQEEIDQILQSGKKD